MADLVPEGPWHAEPDLWNRVTINDVEAPGIATVEITRDNKWDEKEAKGSHGATREYSGSKPAKVRVKIVVWTADDYAELVSKILPIVEPVKGKKKIDAIKIGHAVAHARNCPNVTVDSVAGPTWSGGTATLDIDATEHSEPDKKNATGTAGAGSRVPKNANCQQLANGYDQARERANRARSERSNLVAQRDDIQSTAATQNRGSSLDDIVAAQQSVNQGEVADLNRRIAEQDAQIAVNESVAKQLYTEMERNGCTNARPSGSPATTGPSR